MADNESMSYSYINQQEKDKEMKEAKAKQFAEAYATKAINQGKFKGMSKAGITAMILEGIRFAIANEQGQHKTARDLFSGRYLAGGGLDPLLDAKGAEGFDRTVSLGFTDLFDETMSDKDKAKSIGTGGQYENWKNFGKSTEDTWRAVTGGMLGGESDFKSVTEKTLKPWETFGGPSRRDREEAQEVENTGTIKQAFNQAFGRDPTEAEDTLYRDAIRAGQLNSPQEVLDDLKSQPEYNQRHSEGGGEEMSYTDSLKQRLNSIGMTDLMPESEYNYINQKRGDIQSDINDIRSGKIAPEVASPEQRARYFDRAYQTYQRALDASNKQNLTYMSQRGILPSVQTGVSTPSESILAKTRAEVYEDPLTSYMREYDISEEDWRRNRAAALMDKTFNMQNTLLNSGQNVGQWAGNLRANLAQGLGSLGLGYAQLDSLDAYRNSSLAFEQQKYADLLQQKKDAEAAGDADRVIAIGKELYSLYKQYNPNATDAEASGATSLNTGSDSQSGYDYTDSGTADYNTTGFDGTIDSSYLDTSTTSDFSDYGSDASDWGGGYDLNTFDSSASMRMGNGTYPNNVASIKAKGAPMSDNYNFGTNPYTNSSFYR